MKFIENIFESFLFNCRFFALIAVIAAIVASLSMFLKGGIEVFHGLQSFILECKTLDCQISDNHEVIVYFISSVDHFLFATVLLIFSMGIYELFISKIDPADRQDDTRPNWLRIQSLDDLKGYLGKVIMMILIVNFFKISFNLKYAQPVDLLTLGGAVLLIALSLYFTNSVKPKSA